MNEVIAVLMYLFEKHMGQDCYIDISNNLLEDELKQVGFEGQAVSQALNWLDGLMSLQRNVEELQLEHHKVIRVFSNEECIKLNEECRGYILSLEQIGILNPMTRELVIDRLMALESEIELMQVKWVSLMVLFNQHDKATALACMERLVLEPDLEHLH